MTTDENDIVLDPFMGTGTTAIAAKKLKRNYIGFELDKDYWQIANEKINKTQPNDKLNDCWASFYLNKVVTIRNQDWQAIQDCYYLPSNPQDIDHTPIMLKYKVNNQSILGERNNIIKKNNLFTYTKTKVI